MGYAVWVGCGVLVDVLVIVGIGVIDSVGNEVGAGEHDPSSRVSKIIAVIT